MKPLIDSLIFNRTDENQRKNTKRFTRNQQPDPFIPKHKIEKLEKRRTIDTAPDVRDKGPGTASQHALYIDTISRTQPKASGVQLVVAFDCLNSQTVYAQLPP